MGCRNPFLLALGINIENNVDEMSLVRSGDLVPPLYSFPFLVDGIKSVRRDSFVGGEPSHQQVMHGMRWMRRLYLNLSLTAYHQMPFSTSSFQSASAACSSMMPCCNWCSGAVQSGRPASQPGQSHQTHQRDPTPTNKRVVSRPVKPSNRQTITPCGWQFEAVLESPILTDYRLASSLDLLLSY